MFDWNDEELANIIWGESGQGDDRIVPYTEDNKDNLNKKERNLECVATKLTERNTLGKGHGSTDARLESSSNFDKDGGISSLGVSMDSWADLSSSNFAKNDREALTTEVSSGVSKTAKYDSAKEPETAQPDRDHQGFANPREEKQNDFVDYGWENIGSFDDLDRIFSNDESVFGHVLGNADELWCSKGATNSSLKCFSISGDSPNLGSEALTDAPEILQVKAENAQQGGESLNHMCGELDDPQSLNFQHGNELLEHPGQDRNQRKLAAKEQSTFPVVGANTAASHLTAGRSLAHNDSSVKIPRPKKHHKSQKKQEGKTERRISRDLYTAWSAAGNSSGHYEHHQQLAAPTMQPYAPSVMNQSGQLPGLNSFHHHHFAYPYLYPPAYGNIPNPYPASPSLSPNFQPGKFIGQAVSEYEVSPGEIDPINKKMGSFDKPPVMTPQEKIEKLRRRQQMQAMLAIQKQQEQFSSQASPRSIAQKGPVESQLQHLDGADAGVEDASALLSADTSSAVEQEDSITVVPVDFAVEDVVLHGLQDVIAKLDSRIRLCIRDSLFRLAKSAVHRHYGNDTGSTNTCLKDEREGLSKEDKYADKRDVGMPDVETETNPIDRAVAHLLFHRPLESSVKGPGTPDSPLSTKGESKTPGATNLFRASQTDKDGSCRGPKGPKDDQEITLLKSRPCLDVPENASNTGPGEGGAMDFEASQ